MAPEPVMLEGRIWRLQFQTGPAPTLELDLSLTLYDLQPSAILWKMDIPADGTLPFWIGLGCKPEEMVPAALEELEAAAMLHFRSEQFIRAIGGQVARRETASPDPGGSHKVVASTSWTTSEQGQITATAHESGTQAHANDTAGDDIRPPAPVKRVARGEKAKETARAL